MLRLAGAQVDSLLDELPPVEVRELPAELAALDRLLADPRLLAPIQQAWEPPPAIMVDRRSRWAAWCG